VNQVPTERVELPRQLRDERDLSAGVAIATEQSRFFSQLFTYDGEDDSYGGGSPAGKSTAMEIAMVQTLAEQLVPRLQGVPAALQAVLYLPKLGRIQTRIERKQGTWNIELEAEHEAAARWLSGVRQCCQSRIAQASGQSVSLHVTRQGCA